MHVDVEYLQIVVEVPAQQRLVANATEDELYGVMDWLLVSKGRIKRKIEARDLAEDSLVLYDFSYFSRYRNGPASKRHRIPIFAMRPYALDV